MGKPNPSPTAIKTLVQRRIAGKGEHIWGFADLTSLLHERFKGYDYGVVIGKKLDNRIIDSIIEGPTMEYHNLYMDTNRYLSSLVGEIANELNAMGIKSLAINPTPSNVDRADDYAQTLRNTFSHKMVATRAGLGWIGKTDLFISKKFGPRLRLASILLDYPLKSLTPPVDKSRCGKCSLCVEACPAKAGNGKLWNIRVDRNEFYDAFKCKETANRLSLDMIGHDMRLCGICVSVCPIGHKTKLEWKGQKQKT